MSRPFSSFVKGSGEAEVRHEASSGRKFARGKCGLGNTCDADRIISRLEDAPDSIVRNVVLCGPCFRRTPLAKKAGEEAREGGKDASASPEAATVPPEATGPVKGRKREGAKGAEP